MEVSFDTFREHLDRARLGESRRALYQQVAIAQQRNEHTIDEVRLADDQAARMRLELLELFYDAHGRLFWRDRRPELYPDWL